MAAVTGAHVWAGGELPALPWLVAMSGLVYLSGALLMRGSFSLLPAALGVGAAQFGLHHLLTAMSPDTGHAHGTMLGEMSGQMLFAHAVGAVATWLIWALRRRSLDAILHWAQLLASPLPTAPRALVVEGRRAAPIALRVVRNSPRRGPPQQSLSLAA